MVANLRRSLSFSNTPSPPPPPPPPSSSTSKTAGKRIHFRSISLPTRSHPILFQLKYHLNQLKSQWGSDPTPESLHSNRILDALIRLRTILECLDDLLDLAPSRDSLRRHPEWVEKVLEDFLVMVDVYGTFQMQISTLKQCNIAAQLATRRKDGLKISVCIKGLKKTGREIFKLMPFLHGIQEHNPSNYNITGSDPNPNPDVDLVGVIRGVVEVIVMISEAVFGGISGSFETRKTSWMMGLKKSKREKGIAELENGIWSLRSYEDEVMKKKKMMKEMEECIDGIESGCERVFRGLINTRVSFLNVLTQ
ncbi:uncharacterized protein LOC112510159 [Cynara cardunculus var. scolymus]|uniref:uncharacterized protein LOC112510159 n=1 Tax=Cynara cardunculus var. scolymus TaxID=59895 RepID=UPI000D62D8F8|nr:uncharacterized protein LOC112510159 [Cynara cardunculus var. scolymus]